MFEQFHRLHKFLHQHMHPFEHLTHGAIVALIVLGAIKLELFVTFLVSPKLRWAATIIGFVITIIASLYYERNILNIKKQITDWL